MIKLYLYEGRTYRSLQEEYGVDNTVILTNGFRKKMEKTPRDIIELAKKYRVLADKSTKIQEKLDKITATLKDKGDRAKVLETYINDLKASNNNLVEFDERLFYALVDRVKVNKYGIVIIWKNGAEI